MWDIFVDSSHEHLAAAGDGAVGRPRPDRGRVRRPSAHHRRTEHAGRRRRGRHRGLRAPARRLRRHRRGDAAAAVVRVGARGSAVHAVELPAVGRRAAGAARPPARSAGGGRRRVPRRRRRRVPDAGVGANSSPRPATAEPAAEFADPDAVGRRAVHLGHHVEAQSRRTHPQQPDQLHHRHRRVRLRRPG